MPLMDTARETQMVSRAEIYQARAAECEASAATVIDPKARATFMELAEQWRNLALQTEQREREEPPEP